MSIWDRYKKKKSPTASPTSVEIKKKVTRTYKGNDYTIFTGMSNYIWILDAGHGGIINGTYQTEGKRSPVWEDGSQLFEGVSNRGFVMNIAKQLESMGITYVILCHTEHDTPLAIRTELANKIASEVDKKCIYVSIHSDAWKTPDAIGWSVFTSPGQTSSDIVAQEFALTFKRVFPNERLRFDNSDGDLDKEAKFWVLRETRMAAILTENFFMTNPRECKNILLSREGRAMIEQLHFEAILRVENKKLLG